MKKHVYDTMKNNRQLNIVILFGIIRQSLFMLRKRSRFEVFR